MVILGESGSGKTLSYLLPVINDLQYVKDEKELDMFGSIQSGFDYSSSSEMEEHVDKINRGYFRFNAQTEGEMFQNANELYY